MPPQHRCCCFRPHLRFPKSSASKFIAELALFAALNAIYVYAVGFSGINADYVTDLASHATLDLLRYYTFKAVTGKGDAH